MRGDLGPSFSSAPLIQDDGRSAAILRGAALSSRGGSARRPCSLNNTAEGGCGPRVGWYIGLVRH